MRHSHRQAFVEATELAFVPAYKVDFAFGDVGANFVSRLEILGQCPPEETLGEGNNNWMNRDPGNFNDENNNGDKTE